MTFRKYTANDRALVMLILVCAAGVVFGLTGSLPCEREDMPWLIGMFTVGMMILLAVRWFSQETVRIDENGIACLHGKRLLWSLSWEEIDSIRTTKVYRCKGYVIVPREAPVQDLQKPESLPDFRIQHTRALRAALEKFVAKFQ